MNKLALTIIDSDGERYRNFSYSLDELLGIFFNTKMSFDSIGKEITSADIMAENVPISGLGDVELIKKAIIKRLYV